MAKTNRGAAKRPRGRTTREAKPDRSPERPPPGASLAEYDRKRDFRKTPEPGPEAKRPKKTAAGRPIFVVQEHHASRLHYDFRLESGGVLKSWAVPKEPTLDPAVKRLAARVEDHPLPYAKFTGDIPAGQYGAGHVEIWDEGTYENLNADDGANLDESIGKGRVEIELHGRKLKGRFILIRTRGRGRGENWLLMKLKDRYAKAGTAGPAAPDAPDRPVARARSERGALTSEASVQVEGKPGRVEFTNTDKVMFPEPGFTKGDVLKYYLSVADRLLPHLRDRPVTLERLPDGLNPGAPRFWQKNTPRHYPSWIPRVELPSEGGKPVQYALVNNAEALAYLVNQGALTFHVWFSRVGSLARPDFVLFDLDPGETTFRDAVTVAKALRTALDEQDVPAFVKTSGKTGLHVLTPWRREGGYDEARDWAMSVARLVVEQLPDLATTERLKSKRGRRLYLDVIQNAAGHHAVPPYVLRATPGATVSTPLDWKELTPTLDPKQFDLKTAPRRFARQKADPMGFVTGH